MQLITAHVLQVEEFSNKPKGERPHCTTFSDTGGDSEVTFKDV
jgi:hypothetical protein